MNDAREASDARDYFLKFGGGKPLGFGSIRIKLMGFELYTGKAKAAALAGFSGRPETLSHEQKKALIENFRRELAKNYSAPSFADVPFIAAFLQSAAGYADTLPTRYPRRSKEPNPLGENFRWFVENAKNGKRHALPGLCGDPGLPVLKP